MQKLSDEEKALVKKVRSLDWASAIQKHRELVAKDFEAIRRARMLSMQIAHTRWVD